MEHLAGIADQKTIEWLLEEENPSVRYFTLRDLLGKPEQDEAVTAAKCAIMDSGAAAQILAKQNEAGYWGTPERFYLDKYAGSSWQLLFLAELGADGKNEQVRKAAEFILQNSQDTESSGFSINKSGTGPGGRRTEVLPCLTGNMAFSLIRVGYLEDPRVQGAIDWICRYQRCDDGDGEPPAAWPYARYDMCWGRHTCHMGVVKSLKALAEIPEARRDERVRAKIGELTEYLLRHHIHKKSHALTEVSRPGWLKPGFPLMYQTDVFEILDILTSLGCRDGRMDDALQVIRDKQNPEGCWKLENSFNGKMLQDIELKNKSSKWITLRALKVLLRAV